jgi:ferredoxin
MVSISKLKAAPQAVLRREFLRLREAAAQRAARAKKHPALVELHRVSNKVTLRESETRETILLCLRQCLRCKVERFEIMALRAWQQSHGWRCAACVETLHDERKRRDREAIAAKRAEARGTIKRRRCSQCRDWFLPKTAAARSSYCGSACRQAAYRARAE